jgi:Na+-transporting methylmalonyl-CoA/oxaloacetate decarboxylase gamma subunit
MNATFLESLRVMGLGMLGIFIVTIILIGMMVLLMKLFPDKKKKEHAD